MLNVAVLVSGGGTNLQALIDAQARGELGGGRIAVVISSRRDAYALERAASAGIPTEVLAKRRGQSEEEYSRELSALVRRHDCGLVVLAGFLRILSAEFCAEYENRIINVHPSLLPEFCGDGMYGLRVHEAVLAAGRTRSGASVHFVNAVTDGGPVIFQKAVEVLPGDTPESLQQRIMAQAEHVLLPRAVALFCQNRLHVRGGKVYIEGEEEAMETVSILELLRGNAYPGRGIALGLDARGEKSVIIYFIMGRSENSRNRVFVPEPDGIRTQAHDESKMSDPSLIIYHPVRTVGGETVVTNGDQTDTAAEALRAGKSFIEALRTREFEPDAPNYTPRISGLLHANGSYDLSILKSDCGDGSRCLRFFWEYPLPQAGTGHFIHTYRGDGSPLPSFEGEPRRISLPAGGAQEIAREVWSALNEENKVSLFVRTVSLADGSSETVICNKHQ